MNEKKLRLVTSESIPMTKEERYKLIAQIVKDLDYSKDSSSLDDAEFDENYYTELNFDKVS